MNSLNSFCHSNAFHFNKYLWKIHVMCWECGSKNNKSLLPMDPFLTQLFGMILFQAGKFQNRCKFIFSFCI